MFKKNAHWFFSFKLIVVAMFLSFSFSVWLPLSLFIRRPMHLQCMILSLFSSIVPKLRTTRKKNVVSILYTRKLHRNEYFCIWVAVMRVLVRIYGRLNICQCLILCVVAFLYAQIPLFHLSLECVLFCVCEWLHFEAAMLFFFFTFDKAQFNTIELDKFIVGERCGKLSIKCSIDDWTLL